MTPATLLLHGLRFHWRSHLGVLLGATVGTAVLVGALSLGDSVHESLRGMALARLGSIQLALNSQDRFFRSELSDAIAAELKTPVAPVVLLRGTAAAGDLRAGRIQVVGVDERFWRFAPKLGGFALDPRQESLVLSDRLAAALGVKPGNDVLLRVDKPSLLSRDAPLSTVSDTSVAIRLPVAGIVSDDGFGRFGLEANQLPPMNAFVPLDLLQRKIGLKGRANVLLVGSQGAKPANPSEATTALWRRWQFADAGLELRQLPGRNTLELRSDRVFLDPPVGQAASKATSTAQGVLTYFVNEIRNGDRSTPYSTVSALEGTQIPRWPSDDVVVSQYSNFSPSEGALIPKGMRPDEILVNQWLADDLRAKVGDKLSLKYWIVGPLRKLAEHTSTFRVRGILPLAGKAKDPELMPSIPGLADKKNCRDWEPGVPIVLKKIRDKDQRYWDLYRGTPKAFITLRAGQEIWNNRFGDLTAVRFPMAAESSQVIEARIRRAINPASLGLFFVPVHEQALAASSESLDFGQLFLGFSLFLIVAAILLTALLFALGVEQRAEEIGILLGVGWRRGRVQHLLLGEGCFLALGACVLGTAAAVFYTKATVYGLSTVWRGAVASSPLQYHAEPLTLVTGGVAGFLVALLAIWSVTRAQARLPARDLLSGTSDAASRPAHVGKRTFTRYVAVVGIGGAIALSVMASTAVKGAGATYFFSAGALLLIGGIAACHALLVRLERISGTQLSLGGLGVRNTTRRIGRSLSTISLLACGSFLVIAVGANRSDSSESYETRSSGTGGFAMYGETTMPVYRDLNTSDGWDDYGLDPQEVAGIHFVPMRLREGDEASCLNLNRAQVPSLLGVQPGALTGRFTFVQGGPGLAGDPWSTLDRPGRDDTIPVVGDMNTVEWALGKSLGHTLPYVDDRGNLLKLRIVGILANSILQGHLILSEGQFVKHFPTQSGYKTFLIDAPQNRISPVSQTLTRAMEDVGMSLTATSDRLAAFNSVEDTYLSIFAMLGGLGLLLGSLGLAVVLLRNMLERRSELALFRAVGFRVKALHWLVFSEHAVLLSLGLAVGVVAALVAVFPALRSPGTHVPVASLALTLGAVFAAGFIWVAGAAALALRGPLLAALRNE